MSVNRQVDILLIEDTEADARLTMEVLSDGPFQHNIVWAKDGDEAMQALRREAPFENAARPDVILLDLNLPRRHGREILADIKADPQFKSIPVVVLTTSTAEEDIVAAYTQFANCYIAKPLELDEFETALESLEEFWLNVAKLPPKP